jgi:hypothetical protein
VLHDDGCLELDSQDGVPWEPELARRSSGGGGGVRTEASGTCSEGGCVTEAFVGWGGGQEWGGGHMDP